MHETKAKINTSKERFLPVQDFLTDCYKQESTEYYDRLHELLLSFNNKADNTFAKLKFDVPAGFNYFTLGSDFPSLQLLQFLIRLGNYKRVLEIGTFIGVSAMHLADAAGTGAHVVTVEVGKDFAEMATRNIEQNGYSDRVTVLNADANQLGEYLSKSEPFDFISIDGDKGRYYDLFLMVLPHLSQRGLILVDDALFHGDVLNDVPSTEKGKGVKVMLDEIAKRHDVEAMLLPLSNGKLLIRKK